MLVDHLTGNVLAIYMKAKNKPDAGIGYMHEALRIQWSP